MYVSACEPIAGRIYLAPLTILIKITQQNLGKCEPSSLTLVWAGEGVKDELKRKDGGWTVSQREMLQMLFVTSPPPGCPDHVPCGCLVFSVGLLRAEGLMLLGCWGQERRKACAAHGTGAVLWRDNNPSDQPQNILWGSKSKSSRGEAHAGFHRVIVQQPLPMESRGHFLLLWKEIQVLIKMLISYCNVYWGKY